MLVVFAQFVTRQKLFS